MSKSVVSRGKNIKEAVATALELLDARKTDVDIEIIESESRGFLGIRSKPAVVRVTVKEYPFDALEKAIEEIQFTDFPLVNETNPGTESFEDESMQDNLQGKVWIRDGHILCKNAPDKFPIIVPKPGVTFYRNDQLIEKSVVAHEDDILRVEIKDEVREPNWNITISDNRLEALLQISPGYRLYRRLKDKAPSNYVELEVIEHIELYPIEPDAVLAILKEMEVTVGIDLTEIVRACRSEEPGKFVVARGIEPVPGTNGFLMPMKELEMKRGIKKRADGSIDYREIQEFPSVERGQLVAVIYPPVPGNPGTSVTGMPLPPSEVYPLTVAEGKGIAIVDEVKIVATEAGQPSIKMKGLHATISVVPKLTIPHDVNIKSGNVHYAGDVEVLGTVQDGMLVEAQGNILVKANVHMAKIVSGSSILVYKNVITSELSAGRSNMMLQELSLTLAEIHEQLGLMVQAMQQIMSVSAYKTTTINRTGLGPFFKILCDGKFKSLPPLIISLRNKIKAVASELNAEWITLSEKLYTNFVTPHVSSMKSMDDVHNLLTKVGAMKQASDQTEDDTGCFVEASYIQNGKVYSTGDIHIVGEGVYNSKLHAKGMVHIDGYVRGGEIYAERGVAIREAGTNGGIPTKIQVPKDQTIKLNRVLEDTIIQVGSKVHMFTQEMHLVVARLNKEGVLLLQ